MGASAILNTLSLVGIFGTPISIILLSIFLILCNYIDSRKFRFNGVKWLFTCLVVCVSCLYVPIASARNSSPLALKMIPLILTVLFYFSIISFILFIIFLIYDIYHYRNKNYNILGSAVNFSVFFISMYLKNFMH